MSSSHPLVDLARHDARLFQLKHQIAAVPRRIGELNAERARLESQGREAEARYEQAEAARRKLELELAACREKRAKSEARLATLTSTEQYQALVREMAGQDERIDALESAVLEAMDRSEEVRRGRDADRARLAAEQQALQAQQEQLRAELTAAQVEIPTQTARRDAAVAAVDGATRILYERILKNKRDAAVALLSGQACGICKGVQPPQVLQMLRQSKGLQMCQMCGRILVWDPESA